jgi:copper transport protein
VTHESATRRRRVRRVTGGRPHRLTLSLSERGIEPRERNTVRGPDGDWHVRGVPLPFAGRWHMRIDALVTDLQKVTLEDDFEVH